MSTLTNKAMLTKLTVRYWSGKKRDRNAVTELAQRHGAKSAIGQFNKQLVNSAALLRYDRNGAAARVYQYEVTLPWMDEGIRILPVDMYFPFVQKMNEFKAKADAALEDFLTSYKTSVANAKEELGSLFNAADYPALDDIRGRFGFSVTFLPLPDSKDWRVDVGAEEVTQIKADIEKRLKETEVAATTELWDRLYDTILHMQERLSDKDAVFRDSLVTKVKDLVNVLPKLNVLGDKKLASMTAEIEKALCAHNPSTLREDKKVRATTAKAAADILFKASAFITPRDDKEDKKK